MAALARPAPPPRATRRQRLLFGLRLVMERHPEPRENGVDVVLDEAVGAPAVHVPASRSEDTPLPVEAKVIENWLEGRHRNEPVNLVPDFRRQLVGEARGG